jgi:nucleotide-binding universal stress UspA family protein
MYRTILVAVDLSDGSDLVLRHAFAIARAAGARVVALHVTEPPYPTHLWYAPLAAKEADLFQMVAKREREAAKAALEDRVAKARGEHREGVTPEARVVSGFPAEAILDEATRAEADLIVLGTHGRRGLSRALLGSIAESVVRTATVPVLTVRARSKPF